MSDLKTARERLVNVVDALTNVYKVANGLTSGAVQGYDCLLPDLDEQGLKQFRDWLDPVKNPSEVGFADLLKSDFKAVHPTHGTIEFKALAKFAQGNPLHDSSNKRSRKFKPLRLFTYPRPSDPNSFADFGVTISMEVAAFSLGYDFRRSDFDLICLNNVELILEFQTPRPGGGMERLFETPSFPVSIEIKIPKPYSVAVTIPDIEIRFFGFTIDLDINFPSISLDWSPLSLRFPDWLDFPFGALDFGDLFGSSFSCNCLPAFVGPDWSWPGPSLYWPNFDIGAIKAFFTGLGDLFDFGPSSLTWMTHKQPKPTGGLMPEWVAIYFDLTKLSSSILGGLAPQQLHLMLGIHSDKQVRAGLLVTSDVLGLTDRSLMMHALVFYEFDVDDQNGSSSSGTSITARPGFTVEVLGGAKHLELAQKVGAVPAAPSTVPPPEAKFEIPNVLSVQADRLGLAWDDDAEAYVFSIDGKVTLKELLRDGESGADLELPFKQLGITTDGRFVLGDAWLTPEKTPQIMLDDFPQVAFLLRSYGYGKKAASDFWIGFSGDLRLKALGLEAGVDRLVFRSNGDVELSGVRIDLAVANVLKLKGSVSWGSALANVPNVAGTSVSGFGGQLVLGIDAIPLGLGLGMTYVKIDAPPDEYVAWSFYLQVPLPVVIPICYCLGLSSVGMLVGQNYIPKPKQQGLPAAEWLEKGLNGDVQNLMDVPRTWTVVDGNFAAGFEVGIASTADNGFIINAKAILVLVVPGPLVMIAGKANILSKANPAKSGAIDLLIVYDHDDPGILVSLAFGYKIQYLASVSGMAELYFSFTKASDWHFYLGTPKKRIAGSVLGIFDAKAYLTLDAQKLAVGAMVFYGKRWVFGPLKVKCYVSFSAEVTIGWNPAFVFSKTGLVGEIGATVFGFGLEAGLSADLAIRAPDPWYLMAKAEARFRISFFFFSWSYTATLEFSWGQLENPPDVELDILSRDDKRLELTSSASQSHASLVTDNPGSRTGKIPMDGVFGLRFLRDTEIDDSGANFPTLEGTTAVSVKDEKSPDAGNVKRFHGKLTGLEVRKQASNGGFAPVTRSFHFDWTPLDEAERKKLAVRDFDLGYSQFRLNDDPNAHVQLTCPAFYASASMLHFGIDQSAWEEHTGRFALLSPVTLPADSPAAIELRLTTTGTNDPADVTLDYSDATADLAFQPVVTVDRTSGTGIIVRPGFAIEFSTPAAAIGVSLRADAAAAGAAVSDLITLYDEFGDDMTDECINHRTVLPDGGFGLLLNDFDTTAVATGKQYSTQRPPRRGVKRIVIEQAGALRHVPGTKAPWCLVTMVPQEAVEDIHRRNIERLEQRAELTYLFGQNGDPGKLLWEPGNYQVSGKTVWETDAGDLAPTVDISTGTPDITHDFTVIAPFESTSLTVNGDTVEVQPYEGYERRLVPTNGQKPFYRSQHPVVAYQVNYVNAMLQLSDHRLAMVLRDADGDPLTYTRWWVDAVRIGRVLEADLSYLARRADAVDVAGAADLVERIEQFAPGVDPQELVTVLDRTGLSNNTAAQARTDARHDGSLRIRRVSRAELLAEANGLARRRERWTEDPRRDTAIELRETVEASFADAADRAGLIVEARGAVVLLRLRTETKVAEYRYTNDDLALDVTSLDLSDCLGTTPTKLNAYERGYFAPVIPSDATFAGPKPRTAYSAEVYCLGETADLEHHLVTAEPLSTTPFTASAYHDPEGLADLFSLCKVRDAMLGSVSFAGVVADLDSTTMSSAFAHPGASTVSFDVGADIFRKLSTAAAVTEAGKTPHQVEEEYQSLYDVARSEIDDERTAESLLLDDLADTLGFELEPTSPRRVVATWLRSDGSAGSPSETYGLLIEFPEPIDWDRTALSLDTFTVDLDGQTIDMLQLEATDSRYDVDLHWIRSRDGTRLLLVPVITLTTIASPRIAADDLDRPTVAGPSRFDIDRLAPTAARDSDIAAPGRSPRGVEPERAVGRWRRRLSDIAVASTTGPIDRTTYERYAGRYGLRTSRRITRYEPDDVRVGFYFLSDNHEGTDARYRAIPRLRFRDGSPGDANGRIGTLEPLNTETP